MLTTRAPGGSSGSSACSSCTAPATRVPEEDALREASVAARRSRRSLRAAPVKLTDTLESNASCVQPSTYTPALLTSVCTARTPRARSFAGAASRLAALATSSSRGTRVPPPPPSAAAGATAPSSRNAVSDATPSARHRCQRTAGVGAAHAAHGGDHERAGLRCQRLRCGSSQAAVCACIGTRHGAHNHDRHGAAAGRLAEPRAGGNKARGGAAAPPARRGTPRGAACL